MPRSTAASWIYMAPELREKIFQQDSKIVIDSKADAWSIGVVILECSLRQNDKVEEKIPKIQTTYKDTHLEQFLLAEDPKLRKHVFDFKQDKKRKLLCRGPIGTCGHVEQGPRPIDETDDQKTGPQKRKRKQRNNLTCSSENLSR